MKSTWLKKRLGTLVAALSLAAGVAVMLPAPAQAAPSPVYWTFRNLWVGMGDQCLTGGKLDGGTSRVFMATCNGSNFQQWDWRGSDPDSPIPHHQLQNKATGTCLATDNKSYNGNAVWTSTCEWRRGMRFHYYADSHYLCPLLTSPSPCLSAQNNGAVYGNTNLSPDIAKDGWIGTHS
ncbi:hypothetical protein GCM10027168_35950 [Streptomyces capparidis]